MVKLYNSSTQILERVQRIGLCPDPGRVAYKLCSKAVSIKLGNSRQSGAMYVFIFK